MSRGMEDLIRREKIIDVKSVTVFGEG